MRLRLLACAAGLALVPAVAGAQYVPEQDSTLRGLQKVYLNVTVTDGALDSDLLERITSTASLELRKAGVRLARTTDEIDMSKDAVLNVVIVKIPRALSTDMILRVYVAQSAELTRTKQAIAMATWFYEDNDRNVVPDQFAPAAVAKGINEFLNHWLSANGR